MNIIAGHSPSAAPHGAKVCTRNGASTPGTCDNADLDQAIPFNSLLQWVKDTPEPMPPECSASKGKRSAKTDATAVGVAQVSGDAITVPIVEAATPPEVPQRVQPRKPGIATLSFTLPQSTDVRLGQSSNQSCIQSVDAEISTATGQETLVPAERPNPAAVPTAPGLIDEADAVTPTGDGVTANNVSVPNVQKSLVMGRLPVSGKEHTIAGQPIQPRIADSAADGTLQSSTTSESSGLSANDAPLSGAVRVVAVIQGDRGANPPDDKKDWSITSALRVGVPEPRTLNNPSTPVSTKQTAGNVAALTDAIRFRLDDLRQRGRLELHLDLSPPDLGRVRVQLIAHDQEVDVRLMVQDETARHVLVAQVESLRHRLSEVGISLGHVDVRRDGSGSQHARQDQSDELQSMPSNKSGMPRRSLGANAARGRNGIDLIA